MFDGVLSAFCSEPHFLELNPLGVNKGDGLRWLLNYADVDPASVIAFGDTPSDIPMICMAGKGVAMGNAPQAVKDVADVVALSNEEDGVAQMLQSMY
jgi:hydroxymethylpyrimidine pyrophosphatase-like HAD family hydrolase